MMRLERWDNVSAVSCDVWQEDGRAWMIGMNLLRIA